MDISFIIPIYNTQENLLLRCFESILKLKYIEYEVLLIDDGSEFFVKNFCENFVKDHENFYYLRKNNAGVSEARNYGIKNAKGKYLFFVDSDDTIFADNLDKDTLNKDIDVIIYNSALVDEKKKIPWYSFDGEEGYKESKEAILCMMHSTKLNNPFAKFIKRELIVKNEIYFDRNIVTGEDADFLLNTFLLNPTIYYNNKVIYYYWRTDESARKRRVSHAEKLINNYEYHKMKKLKVLEQLNIDSSSKVKAQISVVSLEIKNIFNLAINLNEEKMLSDLLKEKVAKAINNVESEILMKCNRSTKLRYYILKKNKWFAMKNVGFVRKIYLKFMGLHI